MPVNAQEAQPEAETPSRTSNPFAGLLSSPYLWGAVATFAFYQAIPWLPVHRDLIQRYFCGHPLEYVLAGLFFFGIAILLKKAIGVASEKTALLAGIELLAESRLGDDKDATKRAARLEREIAKLPADLQDSACLSRIGDASAHVGGQGSGRGVGEHLK